MKTLYPSPNYVTGYTAGALAAPNSSGNNQAFVAKITGVPEPSATLLLGARMVALLGRWRGGAV